MELPIHHVAIAVESIATAQPLFESISGAAGSPVEHVAAQQVNVVFIGSGPGMLELLEPAGPDSTVARFLDRRGPGLHHIAYHVPDLEVALARFAADGYELIDQVPRPGAGGHRVAFLHPRSTGGVLVELVGE
ncbi:MAG TPA: methylmalonyl-CoA epimerase [Longimicrobiales bacterium]|nr:methylmalonyl-CoA epimerase [Longimicrobiales bacterium]